MSNRSRRVLITGAAGGIGSVLRDGLRGEFGTLRLSDCRPLSNIQPSERFDLADLASVDDTLRVTRDIDTIVHLGGKGVEGDWETVLNANIIGTYNLFEAARVNGVRRIVFASSNHVVGYYRRETPIGPDAPLRPDSRYGVSKVFGEALGRLYADKHAISFICLRIGCCFPEPLDTRMLSEWISHEDMVRLVRSAITAENVHFLVVYGQSDNVRSWWENPGAAVIGYQPQDRAEDFAAALQTAPASANDTGIALQFQGGQYTMLEFSGDADSIV